MLASQLQYAPVSLEDCKKAGMCIQKIHGIYVNSLRRMGHETECRVLPVLADRRLIDKGIAFQHTSQEARSAWGRRQHHSVESILRQNITSEIGFAAAGLQNMIVKFVEGCELCSIIRQ